jgi:NAD(P)-dependent dehydrogenase (short-subunit alcohol dehydrogenase family)
VLVTDVQDEAGAETARLVQAEGGSARFAHVDVTRSEDLEAAVGSVMEATGRLDVFVNNAGLVFNAPITETGDEDWQRVLAVNLTGTWLGCKHAIGAMAASDRGGAIVNIASIAGLVAAFPGQPAYIAAKGGVVQLTKALAIDYAAAGIRVNAVCPGVVDTPMIDAVLEDWHADPVERAAAKESLRSLQPNGRMASPENIADVVVYLASSRAHEITGAVIPVDGGIVAR